MTDISAQELFIKMNTNVQNIDVCGQYQRLFTATCLDFLAHRHQGFVS